jgi:Dna[CI] antecedent, DciA
MRPPPNARHFALAAHLQFLRLTPAPAAAGQRSRRLIGRFEPGRDVDEVLPPPWEGRPPPRRASAVSRPGFFFSRLQFEVMKPERRSRGFEPLGASGAQALGLSSSRTKDLQLQAAWRQLAGPVLSRRVSAIAVRRGVLELSVATPAWRRAIEHLLPELGARLSRDHPALGVTRFRLVDASGSRPSGQ